MLGDFRIVRELGRGGMAVVYEAEQLSLRRRVALKVLRHHLTLEPKHVERFQREARAAAKLAHEHVVAIHAVGEHDGHAFIAFELIDGPTLASVISTLRDLGRRPTAEDLARATGAADLAHCASYVEACARLLGGVFDALSFAHGRGVLHRDIKPSNILLDARGKPHVADFGLAKDMGEASLSFTGETLGTPYYMSPEQAQAITGRVDERTDVYSLGATSYELLTLSRPFKGRTLSELVHSIATATVRDPNELAPDVSRAVADVLLHALAKQPSERCASVVELRADLERALRGELTRAPRTSGLSPMMGGWFWSKARGEPFEFRTKATVFGWPWIHVVSGVRDPVTRRPKWARGVIAAGDYAVGCYAAGKFAVGFVALGLIAIGPVAIGALAFARAALGGLAVGVDARGLVVAGDRGRGALSEWLLHPNAPENSRLISLSEVHSGPPFDVLGFATGAVIYAFMMHGVWSKLARTASERRLVQVVTRFALPIGAIVPLALRWNGIAIPNIAIVFYLAALAMLGSFVLKRGLRIPHAQK